MLLSSILVYIPTFLFLAIILTSVLKGYIRGLRKSIILLINAFLAFLISMVVYLIIFKGHFDEQIVIYANKVGLDLKDLLNTSENYNTLSEYIRELVWESIPQDYISSNNLLTIISTLTAVVESLFKLAVIIVICILYGIMKCIFYIVYLIAFKESRFILKTQKKYRSGEKESSYQRKPGYGSLVGLGRGLIGALLTFSFIGSLFFILSGGYYSDKKQDIVVEVNGTTYDISEYYDVVNRYGTTGIGKILESVKNSDNVPVYLLACDYLTKGEYVVETPSGDKTNSLYGREELGPIVGFVKETAFLALDYGFETDKYSDVEYLIWFFSDENVINNVCFADKMESIVDKYDFGSYTLYLAQSLATAMADSVIASEEDMSFASKLMYHLFKGENKVEAKKVINNENVDIILKLAINVINNYNEINGFIDEISSKAPQEKLLFGIHKQNQNNSSNALAFAEVIEYVSDAISSLTFMNDGKSDGLISDILIEVISYTMPDFSIENIKNKEDICSIYNVKWNDGLKEVFDIVHDLVMFISDNEIKNLDDLLDKLILGDGEEAKICEFTSRLINSDFAGVVFNADGFLSLINEKLEASKFTLPTNIIYGNYYKDGVLQKGEISKLFDGLSEKVPTVYQMYKEDKINIIGEWVDEEKGLLPLLSSLVDENKENYSKLLHYTISNVLTDLYIEGFEIIIPVESLDSNSIILSSELVNFVNILVEAKISDLKVAPANVNIQEFFIEKVVKLNPAAQRSFVDCKLLNATLINFLEKTTITQDGTNYNMVLPNESLIPNISRKMVTHEEFGKLIAALDVAFDGRYNLEAVTDFDHLLEDYAIDKISQSKILHATLVTVLVDMCEEYEGKNGLLLRIPDNYKNQDFVNNFSNTTWVVDGELALLAKGIKALGVSVNKLSVSDADILKLAIDPKVEGSKLSTLLNSKVMTYTLSKELSNVQGLIVVNPLYEDLFDSVPLGVNNSKVIRRDEIFDFFDAIYRIVGKEEIEKGMTFEQVANVVDINYIKNKNLLNYDALEPIMDSIIIETKISQIIVEEDSILIPREYHFESSLDDNIYNWLSIDKQGYVKQDGECKRILNILDEIGLIDVIANSSSSIDINQFTNLEDDKIDLILTSDVMHATFVSKFYAKCGNSSEVYIPTSYDLNVGEYNVEITDDIIKDYFDLLPIVKNGEVAKLLKGVRYFNLDFNNLNVDPDILFTLDEIINDSTTKLDVIYQSDILWLTLSEQILNQEAQNKIKVPYDLIRETRYQANDRYITLDEVNKLINAMDYLLIESFDQDINSDILTNKNINLTSALESKILWYTMSDSLVNSAVDMPNTTIYTKLSGSNLTYEFIQTSEIESLRDAVIKLGITTGVESLNSNDIIDIIKLSNDDNLVIGLCESTILWYNVSLKIIDTTSMVKPIEIVTTVTEGTKKDTFIDKIELNKLVNSAKRLNVLDTIKNGEEVGSRAFNNLNEADLDYVLLSDIVHATVIFKFYNEITSSNVIQVPSEYQGTFDKNVISNNYNNLKIKTDGEIKKILLSTSELGIDLSNPKMNANIVFDLDKSSTCALNNQTKLDVIYQSRTIWLTLTNKIVEQNTNGTITMPRNSVYDRDLHQGLNDYYVSKSEIMNMISALKTLSIDDITANITSDVLMNKNFTEEEKTQILSSNIIWNTISTKIEEVNVLLKPVDAYTTLDYLDNTGKYKLITKTEIWNIQDILKNKLELSSIDSIEMNDVFDSLELKIKSGNSDIINDICESYLIWYTISDKVLNSNDLVVPTIVNYQVSQSLYIQKAELSTLIQTAVKFDILSSVSNGDQISSESFDNRTKEELELAFESEILHSTIILRFYEEIDGEGGLSLPSRYQLNVNLNELKSDLRLNILSYNIYNDFELFYLLLGAKELGMSFNNPSVSTNDVLEKDLNGESSQEGKSKMDVLYDSKIIWLTLSQKILTEPYLDIPTNEILDKRYEYFDSTLSTDRTVIKLEISNLIKAAKKLGIEDLTSEIDQYLIFKKEDVVYEDITSSKIVWYTVSNKMFNDTTFQIPLDHIYKYVDATFNGVTENYTYITEEELDALIYSCRKLGVDEETIISVNCVFDYDRNETNMVELCQSYIIWFTISRKIGEKSDTIKIPDNVNYEEYFHTENGDVTQVYIDREELDSLVNSLYELIDPNPETGRRNMHEFNIDKYLDGTYTIDKWENLWNNGHIFWYTVSDGIFSALRLQITSDVVHEIEGSKYIKQDELAKFMTAVNKLSPSDFESTNVEFNKVLDSIDVLVESEIFKATISTEIIKGGQKVDLTHVSVGKKYNDSSINVYSINSEDIIDFVGCAKLVGMTDYDDTPTLGSVDDVIILSNSHILCMTYNSEIDTFVRMYDYTNPGDVNEVYVDIEILSYDTTMLQYKISMVTLLSEESILEFAQVKTA